MRLLWVALWKLTLYFTSPIENFDKSESVQLSILEDVGKAATVCERADLRLFLNQVVAHKTEISVSRRDGDMTLWISIQAQDVLATNIPSPLLQVIQVEKVV